MLFEFMNKLGWYAFLTIIPLIIVYLIKPKPVKLKIPSLMFFIKNTSTSKFQSFFRYFQKDILFLIQLLVLLLLAFSIVNPILMLNRDVVSSNIVFVLDVSASSQVMENGNITRLDIAKEKIKNLATSKNSLILLKSAPVVALDGVSRTRLNTYLNRIKYTDDITDISAAIFAAGDLIGNKNSRVVVLSDFAESKGLDPDVAKNILESRGVHVDFIDTKDTLRNNIGIINAVLGDDSVNVYIKNFNNFSTDIKIKANKDESSLVIKPGTVEPIVFKLTDNLTEIKILNEDDFLADNKLIISRPYSDIIKVLLVTNNPSKFLKAALTSINGVVLTAAEPPIISAEDFDIYVIDAVDKNKLVVDNFGSIMREVRDKGKSAIVIGQRDSDKIDYEGLLNVKFNGLTAGGSALVQQTNRFTKDMDFGYIKNVLNASKNGVSLVSVNSIDIISLDKIGDGQAVYYGIFESESDFKLTPGYPIFWNNLISYLSGREELSTINLKAGDIFGLGNDSVVLDKTGVYTFGKKIIAVNLLNEKESDINFADDAKNEAFVNGKLEKVESIVDYELSIYLAVLALLLVLFELFYIKFRGEI